MVALEDVMAELVSLRTTLEERQPPKALMSFRAAAKYLGVDRKTTLRALADAGKIRTVMVNGHVKIPFVEVQRIASEGTDSKPTTRRAQPVRLRPVNGSVAEAVAAFKAKLGSS